MDSFAKFTIHCAIHHPAAVPRDSIGLGRMHYVVPLTMVPGQDGTELNLLGVTPMALRRYTAVAGTAEHDTSSTLDRGACWRCDASASVSGNKNNSAGRSPTVAELVAE